jgi:hypothetical protein
LVEPLQVEDRVVLVPAQAGSEGAHWARVAAVHQLPVQRRSGTLDDLVEPSIRRSSGAKPGSTTQSTAACG